MNLENVSTVLFLMENNNRLIKVFVSRQYKGVKMLDSICICYSKDKKDNKYPWSCMVQESFPVSDKAPRKQKRCENVPMYVCVYGGSSLARADVF
jgi:hypothetical protein